MAATWEVGSGKATYKDGDSVLIEVSGLKSDATDASGISLDGTKITLPSTLLPDSSGTVSITQGTGYTLELSGAIMYGATTTYAVASFSGGSATVEKRESGGWKADNGNNTSFTYTAAGNTDIAKIKLTYTAATGGLSVSANGKTVTVDKSAFNTTSGASATTVSIEESTEDISLAFNNTDSIPSEQATIRTPTLDSSKVASEHTATITQDYTAFYSAGATTIEYTPEKTVTLATITGLQETPSLPTTGKEIEITTAMVGSASGAAVQISGDGGYTIKLKDTDENPDDGKVGFGTQAAQWVDESSTLNYKSSYTKEGWSQDGTSKITYTADTKGTGDDYKTLTTISGDGLADSLMVAVLNSGATVEGKTVTLASSVLGTTNTKTVTVTDSYKITVDDSLKFDHDAATQNLNVVANDTDAKITRNQAAGWQNSGTATITYKGEVAALELATITGLSAGATGVSVDNTAETPEGKTVVTLAAGALKTDQSGTYNVMIADASTPDTVFKNFTLALDGSINTSATKDNETVTLAVDNGTATVKKDYAEYWTLDTSTNKSVTYTGLSAGAGDTVASITGLNESAAKDTDVILNDTTITLKNGALKDADATVTGNYTITLNADVTQEATDETDATKVTLVFEDVKDGENNVTGKTAKVNKDQQKYWTVETGKVEFHEATTGTGTTVATVNGLATTAAASNVVLTTTADTKTITLKNGALKKATDTTTGAGATLDSSTYTFAALDESINTSATKDNETVTLAVTSGTATVKKDYAEYWTLGGDNKSVTYTGKNAGAGDIVAEITELSTTGAKTADDDTATVTLNASTNVITLKQDALAKDKDTPAQLTVGAGTYSISLSGVTGANTDKTGATDVTLKFEDVKDNNNTVVGKTALVKKDQEEYWTLADNKVSYFEATTGTGTTVATLSGLSTAATDSNVTIDKSGKTLTVSKAALVATSGASAILESDDYRLLKNADVVAPAAEDGTPTAVTTELSTGKITYKRTPSAGWTLSEKTITYSQPEDVILAVITGLKNGASASDITRNGTVITVKKAALDDSADGKAATMTTEHGYTFAVGTDVVEPAAKVSNFSLSSVSGGKAIIKGTTSAGWTLAADGKTLTYVAAKNDVEVATVTGLNTAAEKDTDVLFNTNTGNITIKKEALTNSNVTLTTNYAKNFNLVLDGVTVGNTLGGEDIGYWTRNGSTAEYYATKADSWTFTDSKNIKYNPMVADSTTLKATINGLAQNITYGSEYETDATGVKRFKTIGTGTGANFVAGVKVASNAITLNKNILGTTDAAGKAVTMTYTLANGYSIALNNTDSSDPSDTASGYVRQTASTATKFWELGATAKLKQADLEYWTHDTANKKIDYTKRGTETVLATITGLSDTITKDDLAVADTQGADGKYAITLNKNALTIRDVNITSDDYKLALNSSSDETKKVAAPGVDEKAWELNDAKTIATYTAKITTAGYEAASDGSSVTYTAATGDDKIELAKVEGLNGNSELTDTGGTINKGLTLDEGTKVITLTKDVLGPTNVKVTGTNYTLNVGADHTNGIYLSSDTEATTGVDVWRVDGTTATYKKVKYANYALATDKTEITYVPEADATTKQTVSGVEKDVPVVYATVTGLKSGLAVGENISTHETWVGVATETAGVTTVAEDLTLSTKQINLTSNALGTSAIEVDGDGYTLSLGNADAQATLKPKQDGALTWAVTATSATDGTTADIKGVQTAGYELVTTGDKANQLIKYTEKDPNHTFATITGLKSGLTSADLNDATNGVSLASKTLALKDAFLGKTKVVLDEDGIAEGFTFALDGGVATSAAKKDVWKFTDGTASYRKVDEAYYTKAKAEGSSTADTQITYTARTEGTELAKITGLKSNLTVVNDAIAGITPDNESNPTTFTISADVLDKKESTITPGTYTFKLADEAAPSQTGEFFWTVSGTTASYQFNSVAGYTLKDNKISYQEAKSGKNANTVVEISGLKSGVKKADVESNIDVSGGTFKLYKPVLGNTEIKLTPKDAAVSGTTYALALDDSDDTIAKDIGKVGWAKNADNSYTLKQYTPEHWELDSTDTSNQTVKYTAGALGTAIATVTGLKTNLTVQPEATSAQIAGIDVNPSTYKITLSKGVLTTVAATPAKITMADGYTGTDYTFAIAGTDVPAPAYSKAWKASKGTATLTETITLGYTGDGTDTITYQPKKTVTTTISGLKTSVAPETGNQSISDITLKADDGSPLPTLTSEQEAALTEIRDGKFYVASSLLDNKTVTLTNKSGGGTYQLALDGATIVSPIGAAWYKADNATTATYEKRVNTGYVVNDADNPTKFTYYSADGSTFTTLATLKGLTKTVTAAQLNSVIGDPSDPVEANPTATPAVEAQPGKFTIKSSAITTADLEVSDIFGKNTLTFTGAGDYKDYVMAFDDATKFNVGDIKNEDATWTYNAKKGTAELVAGKTEGWAFQVKSGKTNYKSILYTKAAPKTIASISGLATSTTAAPIEVSADGKSLTYVDKDTGEKQQSLTFDFGSDASNFVGKESATSTATILVSAGVLTNKTVTVTPKQTGYTFAFATDTDVFAPKDGEGYWRVNDKGTAFYRYDTSEGYTLGKQKTENDKLTYSKEFYTPLATVSGLYKTMVTQTPDGVKLAQIDGITVTTKHTLDDPTTDENEAANGVITLWDASILTNKVTSSGKYNLAVAPEIAVTEGDDENKQAKWYFKNGTATYQLYNTAGYAVNAKKTTVEKKAETAGKTLVTIKGLAKTIGSTAITADKINQEQLLDVKDDNTITISRDIQNDATITLTEGVKVAKSKTNPAAVYYEYKIDPNTFDAPQAQDPFWSFSKGTATLKQTTTKGYTLTDTVVKNTTTLTGQKLTFSKETTPTVATIKNLNTNLAIETNSENGEGRTVGEIYTATITKSGNTTTTTITGTTPVLSYDADQKIVTVAQDALITKNATISGKYEYKLALDPAVVNKAANVTEWVVSGTTANYKNYDKEYHTLNDAKTAINYVKPTTGTTYATVSGIKKDSTIDTATAFKKVNGTAGDKDGGTLTLNSTNLDVKTITITSKVANQNAFTLALASDDETKAKVSTLTTGSWSTVKSNKSTLSGTLSVGFTQEFGGKTLTYNKTANKSVTIATITGVANDKTFSADASGVITLGADNLAQKNVTVTTSMGPTTYTLDYSGAGDPDKNVNPDYVGYGTGTPDADSPLNPKNKKPGWTISSTTGTLKGYVTSEGYTMSNSATTLTYTGKTQVNTTTDKKTKNVTAYTYKDLNTLATIKGLKTTADKTALIDSRGATPVIKLNSGNTNGNLTINAGTYAVEVDGIYNSKSITGSAGADSLTVAGDKLTVTGGKGDDYIDLGGAANGNTLVYSSGEGNDVIANFTPGIDKLQIKSGTPLVAKSGGDLIVKVGTGSIKLLDQGSAASLTILNAKNVATTYSSIPDAPTTGGSNVLLADDNYSMDAANLSSIVKGDSASYNPYDFETSFSLTKEDKLTPQISYSGNDKK